MPKKVHQELPPQSCDWWTPIGQMLGYRHDRILSITAISRDASGDRVIIVTDQAVFYGRVRVEAHLGAAFPEISLLQELPSW